MTTNNKRKHDKKDTLDNASSCPPFKSGNRKCIEYSEEIIDEILDRIASGESLRQICSDKHLPSRETVRTWLKENKGGITARYARAREEQADFYADQIIEIADSCDDPQKARVQIDARKWIACKLKPTTYGDKVDLSSSDGSMSPLRQITIEFIGNDDDTKDTDS